MNRRKIWEVDIDIIGPISIAGMQLKLLLQNTIHKQIELNREQLIKYTKAFWIIWAQKINGTFLIVGLTACMRSVAVSRTEAKRLLPKRLMRYLFCFRVYQQYRGAF